jgi:hypothetical protein
MNKTKHMAQQTAVDWLFEQIPIEWTFSKWEYEAYQRAKQIEKEQIKSSYNQGYRDADCDCYKSVGADVAKFEDSEKYYNETYGK